MASKSTLNAKNLEALGAERLAQAGRFETVQAAFHALPYVNALGKY